MAKKYFNEITSTIQLISFIAIAINPYMDLLFLVFWFLDTETLEQLYAAPEKKRIDYVLTYKTPVNAEDELEVCHASNRHNFFPGLFFYVYIESPNPTNPEGPTPQALNPINWKPQP